MAILNFLNGKNTFENYKEYFLNKETIIFNESFCVGEIPYNIFKNHEAYQIRINAINKAYGIDSEQKYYEHLNKLLDYDYSQVNQIAFYFEEDMYSQINLLALVYFLETKRNQGKLKADYTFYIIEEGKFNNLENSIIEKRYLSKQDIDDLVMTFIYLVHNQNRTNNEEEVKEVVKRIESFTYMKKAICDFFYIKTPMFKEKCKRLVGEKDNEYINRMFSQNNRLGLSALFYLSLDK